MAKLVPCRSKEEAEVAAAAGVLWLRFNSGWSHEADPDYAMFFVEEYGTKMWSPEDFAIQVEDSEDG